MQFVARYDQGLEITPGVLEDLTAEEMSHIAGILQRQQGPVNEDALDDCVRTIRAEQQLRAVSTEDDLMRFREKLKERKGIHS